MTQGRRILLCALAVLVTGCLGPDEVPTAAPTSGFTLPTTTEPPRTAGEMVVAVPFDPGGFVPPSDDETGSLLGDLLYDPLYRLDSTLTPQPALASSLPQVSADGLTWRIALRSGGTFHDDTAVEASDAGFTLDLAASPDCPFGRSVCDAVASHLAEAAADGPSTLVLTLSEAWSPFLAVVLGRLPILSESAVRTATNEMVRASADLDAVALSDRVGRILDETNADRCLVAAPPTGCQLSDYADELTGVLERAGLTPPPDARFTGAEGEVDTEAEGAALLQAVGSLAMALGSSGIDQQAAAVPLIDVARHPLGGGPFRLDGYAPGVDVRLVRHDGHQPDATLDAIRLRIVRDPAVAATALRSHDVDWVLWLDPGEAVDLATEPGLTVTAHPNGSVRSIIFNVRPGRTFAEPVTREAFALCIDRAALVEDATGGAAVAADFETAAGSWALSDAPAPALPDPPAAVSRLEAEGWRRDPDAIYAKDGVRLSAQIYVRTSRTDLLGFARAAAGQLRACGIDLQILEQDQPGDLLLGQLQWPNDFETVLVQRPLDVDPDIDFHAFESSHATSADNPADANPGGYASPVVDGLLGRARATADPAARASLYGQVETRLVSDPPSYPIWYDPSYAGLRSELRRGSTPIDPAMPRYWWDAWTWDLASE